MAVHIFTAAGVPGGEVGQIRCVFRVPPARERPTCLHLCSAPASLLAPPNDLFASFDLGYGTQLCRTFERKYMLVACARRGIKSCMWLPAVSYVS